MSEAGWDFQEIYAVFHPRLLRYLTRLVGEFEAEDLTQEVFLKVNRALPNFRGESQLGTWIYRIATNAAVDRMRDPSFRHTAPGDSPADPDAREFEIDDRNVWTGESTPSLEQQVFQKEGVACYSNFIKNLPENYRLTVFLNQVGEFTAQEIADFLGLSLGAVKIRLHRGKARLLKELKTHCKAEDWL